MSQDKSPVWLITGCSTGFGRELAKLTIARGWPTVVTARDKARVADLASAHDANALALDLDVTDRAQVKAAVAAAEQRFGRVDVLVNNAGYGYQSTVEEAEEQEIRDQFEANVFGLFSMTRAVLPGMRQRRHGHIINITSVAGFIGFPGSGFYAASKHAVEGFSDSLYAEGRPLGIKVTCVAPGPFRTDWAGRSLRQTKSRIADYAETAASRMRQTSDYSGKQAGDPVRAGEAMIRITQVENPPRHLVLGEIGYSNVTNKLRERLAQIEEWRETSLGADFAKE
ncbi:MULTISPECIES: oxidoreductase [Rhizobium]|uniref:3-oxoacyl-[acyl-carrier-protein] reductase n=1 Tax=Rhizobium favelukesii TaxID=348824 RepID=W6R885_9HYPH|nr:MULTISPECIES: oxidoreductase [Rhizobium]MCA0801595.1 SDR family NAD(P)-dependent oxidoreductase [Rhizobium sp. T1473]MCS0462808.1 SDR family NAD(P)-dependent oxidoreductase [Rhizobium favelukesii]UFS81011.1 SDR family NAD(P)-dependent oxidoreductase [Rhizobium sp. T136]CDM57447.1 3-oxoacyl-[acyl-carrier-protein] reductase [Rhizobium favelukesii]